MRITKVMTHRVFVLMGLLALFHMGQLYVISSETARTTQISPKSPIEKLLEIADREIKKASLKMDGKPLSLSKEQSKWLKLDILRQRTLKLIESSDPGFRFAVEEELKGLKPMVVSYEFQVGEQLNLQFDRIYPNICRNLLKNRESHKTLGTLSLSCQRLVSATIVDVVKNYPHLLVKLKKVELEKVATASKEQQKELSQKLITERVDGEILKTHEI